DEKYQVFDFFNQAVIDSTETHFEIEYKFLRSDGTFADVLDRFDIIWRNGQPVKKVGALQDITTRKFQETILALEKKIYELNANPQVSFRTVIETLLQKVEFLLHESFCAISIVDEYNSI